MEFSTIHRALYLKRIVNEKTGTVSFKPDYNPRREAPFHNTTIAVIDEASMLNSELLYYLENERYNKTVMIFLGDHKQLNPVGEVKSPIFLRKSQEGTIIPLRIGETNIDYKSPHYELFELTKIIRQAEGNPIIHLSYNLPEIALLEPNITETGQGYDYCSDFEQIIEDIVLMGNDIRYLAWTNEECDRVNLILRRRIYGTPNKVELGETIIFSEPYSGSQKDYFNSYELKIESLKVITRKFSALNRFKYDDGSGPQEVTIAEELTYYWINNDVMIIHEDSERVFFDMMKHLRYLTKFGLSWSAVYYPFIEQFARFGYGFAVTVHKAQGGTFKKVVINMPNLNRNRAIYERNSLWYTAITRAAENVTIYNPAFNQSTKDYL